MNPNWGIISMKLDQPTTITDLFHQMGFQDDIDGSNDLVLLSPKGYVLIQFDPDVNNHIQIYVYCKMGSSRNHREYPLYDGHIEPDQIQFATDLFKSFELKDRFGI